MDLGLSPVFANQPLLVDRTISFVQTYKEQTAASMVSWNLELAPGRHRPDKAGRLGSGSKHILRPIDNTAPEDAMSPRYTAEKSGLW
jgi:hypothetical protein